jgi:hypothetical protein
MIKRQLINLIWGLIPPFRWSVCSKSVWGKGIVILQWIRRLEFDTGSQGIDFSLIRFQTKELHWILLPVDLFLMNFQAFVLNCFESTSGFITWDHRWDVTIALDVAVQVTTTFWTESTCGFWTLEWPHIRVRIWNMHPDLSTRLCTELTVWLRTRKRLFITVYT